MKRLFAIAVVLGVSRGVIAIPPAEGAPAGCKPFVPSRALRDDAGRPREESLKAPVIEVGDKATKARPVTRAYEHGPALAFPFYQGPELFGDGHRYFNFQVTSTRPRTGLYIRVDWPTPSASDIDLFLYNPGGRQVAYSDTTNSMPREAEHAIFDPIFPRPINGGPGYELILGTPAPRCAGFMLDSQAAETLGEKMRLTAWLGKIRPQG